MDLLQIVNESSSTISVWRGSMVVEDEGELTADV